MQTNNPVWGGGVSGSAGAGGKRASGVLRLASFSRHSHCMAGPPLEAERPLRQQLRHGMPKRRARRTPRSTQRAAQSHRSDLVALELRGAKLLTTREIQLRCSAAAVQPRVSGVHTSDVPAPAATPDRQGRPSQISWDQLPEAGKQEIVVSILVLEQVKQE